MNAAPSFATLVHTSFREFLTRNGILDAYTGQPLVRFCWCSDGPWDIRDFVVKQCFMSKVCPPMPKTSRYTLFRPLTCISSLALRFAFFQIPLPSWLTGDVLDVRRVVARWQERNAPARKPRSSVRPLRLAMPFSLQLSTENERVY